MSSLTGKAIIHKESISLTSECYNTPNTIPLAFCFEPILTLNRNFTLEHHAIDGKDLFVLHGYFSDQEGQSLREFSETTSFSQKIYGSAESTDYGEIPAKMMNGKERWQFFAQPPSAINALFKLFSFLSHKMDAKVLTLPWCLSDQKTSSNCVATNFLTENAPKSAKLGKHQDYNPESGLAFAIPCLYSSEEKSHPNRFANGAEGRPLMITVMVYATAENFHSDYGMGTLFYDREEKEIKIDCRHMQIVFFEGDIWHTIEESRIPQGLESWRVSYVFKLIFNPKKKKPSLRNALYEQLRSH